MPGITRCFLSVCLCSLLCRELQWHVQARPTPPNDCENTQAGRHYLADSGGYVCARHNFDYSNGCCKSGELHSCETCHVDDQCCASYEHCVSCCMHAVQTGAIVWQEQYRIHNRPETGRWPNAFEFCVGRCRTHKASTSHENSFIDDRHFCFSDSGRPKTVANPPLIPEGVKVVEGVRGKDCNKICNNIGLNCHDASLASVNHCDALREHFGCEAGCQASTGRSEHPAYVMYGSAKSLSPTMCFMAGSDDKPSCSGAQAHLVRLCTCI